MREHPCKKDCPDRTAGCGATCDEWQKYVKNRNAEYEQRLKERESEDIYWAGVSKDIRRRTRNRRN